MLFALLTGGRVAVGAAGSSKREGGKREWDEAKKKKCMNPQPPVKDRNLKIKKKKVVRPETQRKKGL